MDLGLRGKVAVVTGGSKGIGYAAAKVFLEEGAKVAICARHEKELRQAAGELEQLGPVYWEAVDVTDAQANYDFAEHVYRHFGSIDVWVNNVGATGFKKGEEYDDGEIDFMTGVCFKSVVFGCQAGFRYMKEKGVDMGYTGYMDTKIEPDAFAVLIFTSGTTSAAKGVMISNTNLAYNINSVTPYVYLTPEDRLFSVLPLHHTYESTIGFLYPMAVGASIAVCQGLKHIASDMKETSPTAIIAVPLLIESLYKKINQGIEKSGKSSAVKSMISLTNGLKNLGIDVKRKVFKDIYANLGGALRIVVSAAAPIDAKVGRWLSDIGITFLQGYGLTETAPIAALTPDWDTRVGSAGKSVVWDQIKIKEPDEKGEGEILIKGKTVMLGYYEDPEATALAVQDGWFNSGDIGYLDEDGFLYITGRSKNVIVTQNGKNIYPEEIENLLSKVEEIAECMVYGKEVAGEKELMVTARIIPDYERIEELHGEVPAEEDIYKIIWDQIKKVNRKLNNYKTIKKLEIKQDQFEKTSTMKIKRYAELAKDKETQQK